MRMYIYIYTHVRTHIHTCMHISIYPYVCTGLKATAEALQALSRLQLFQDFVLELVSGLYLTTQTDSKDAGAGLGGSMDSI